MPSSPNIELSIMADSALIFTQTQEGGLVLAMDGLWCEDRWFTSDIKPVTKRKKQKFLGGAGERVVIRPVVIDMQDEDENVVEFAPEIKGSVPGVEIGQPLQPEDGQDASEDESEDEDPGK